MNELQDVNIRHIKLVSGEQLIAIIHDQDTESDLMMVQKPMLIKMSSHESGTTFVFYDWQPLAKTDTCFINPFHIVSHVECVDDIKEQYIKACMNTSSDSDTDYEYDFEITPDTILH